MLCYDELVRNEAVNRGGSSIIDPFAQYLAGPIYDKEDILYAELDLGQLAEARFDFDPAGHYNRPDICL